ncbi:hypothetical protein ACFLYO_08465 [Chloroflexota bacterium]
MSQSEPVTKQAEQRSDYFGGPWRSKLARGFLLAVLGLYLLGSGADEPIEIANALAIYIILDGILMLWTANQEQGRNRLLHTAAGIFGVGLGGGILISELTGVQFAGLALTIALLLIAGRAIMVGIVDLLIAYRKPEAVQNRVLVIGVGVFILLFGIFLLLLPFINVSVTVAQGVGAYAFFLGFIIAAEGITGRGAEKAETEDEAGAEIDAELEEELSLVEE